MRSMIASTRLAWFAVGGQHGHELGGEPARIVSGMARVRLAEAGELGLVWHRGLLNGEPPRGETSCSGGVTVNGGRGRRGRVF